MVVPHRAYIGLGSNLDDPPARLQQALIALDKLADSSLTGVSNIYQSPALGPSDQPDYFNAAVQLETGLTPQQLLASLQTIESAQGRVRNVRWGPRTLDLDLLLYDDQVLDTHELVIPHPELTRRSFVLQPLLDIEPNLVLPDGRSVASELAKLGTDNLQLVATAAQFRHACS